MELKRIIQYEVQYMSQKCALCQELVTRQSGSPILLQQPHNLFDAPDIVDQSYYNLDFECSIAEPQAKNRRACGCALRYKRSFAS